MYFSKSRKGGGGWISRFFSILTKMIKEKTFFNKSILEQELRAHMA